MLAKVVKAATPAAFTPVALPEIGSGAAISKEPSAPVIPEVARTAGAAAAKRSLERATDSETLGVPPSEATVDDLLKSARDEAARIIAEAERNADAIAEAAKEKALREMELRFDAEVAAKTDEARADLVETIERINGLAEEISKRHEHDIVELAIQIARKIVGREVTIDREIAFTLVRVSLAKLHDRAVAEVHLNPEDLAYVESHRDKIDFRGALDLVADRAVSVGGCLIHTDAGDVDARVESQFEEIAHGLLT